MAKVSGMILAGGQNRRMNGEVKALLPFHEEPLILRQIREMERVCGEILVVTNDPAQFAFVLGCAADDAQISEAAAIPRRVIADQMPGKGPLAGMHTGMLHASFEEMWVVASDMPFVSSRAAEILLERKKVQGSEAAIPVIGGEIHPLHGIYSRRSIDLLQELLQQGQRSVKNMLGEINWTVVHEQDFVERGVNLRFVTNVNTPKEYRKALADDENGRDEGSATS